MHHHMLGQIMMLSLCCPPANCAFKHTSNLKIRLLYYEQMASLGSDTKSLNYIKELEPVALTLRAHFVLHYYSILLIRLG